MTRCIRFAGLLLAVIVAAQVQAAEVKPEVVARIEKAVPEAAPAKPAKPRKVLVYTQASGFVHSSIPVGAKAFELLGQKTGAFEVALVTNDPAVFTPESLAQYDCLVLISTTGNFLVPRVPQKDTKNLEGEAKQAAEEENKRARAEHQEKYVKPEKDRQQALLDYVKKGGGLVGIHAASDAYYGWKEYGDLIGGYFHSHPYGKITVRIDDPENPINAQFGGQSFEFSDEIYVFRDESFSRDRVRVLLSVDNEKSGISGGPRKDSDYAVAWIHGYGEGRVFYTLLGHREETFMNPLSMRYFLAGTQYALGDLKANDVPAGKLKAEEKK